LLHHGARQVCTSCYRIPDVEDAVTHHCTQRGRQRHPQRVCMPQACSYKGLGWCLQLQAGQHTLFAL
jgi:hypothetical protein